MVNLRSKIMGAAAVAVSVGLAVPAVAAIGGGKVSGDIVSVSGAVGRKPIGKYQTKPSDSKAGKPWTSGSVTAMKFNPEVGDPAKPGLTTGNYVMIVEASATAGGPVNVQTYTTFSYDASTKKCTVNPKPTVLTGSGNCGGSGQAVCADAAVDKCTFTTFQTTGSEFAYGVTDAGANAARIRIATLPSPAGCPTGTLVVSGLELYPVAGPPTHSCEGGTVVGLLGTTAGDVCPTGEIFGAYTCP